MSKVLAVHILIKEFLEISKTDTELNIVSKIRILKNMNVDVKLTDFSSPGFAALYRQNVAPIGEQIHQRTRIDLTETTFGTENKEEMRNKIEKSGDNGTVSNVSEMKTFTIYGALLGSNLEPIDHIKIDIVFTRTLTLRTKPWN